jgi:hypothetical protein
MILHITDHAFVLLSRYEDVPNEVQTIRCIATGGTFTITFRDETTPAIDWNAPPSGDFATVAGTGTIILTHMATTFTLSTNLASTFVAGYYIIIRGSSDLTTADTDVRYVHVTGSVWGSSVTTVTVRVCLVFCIAGRQMSNSETYTCSDRQPETDNQRQTETDYSHTTSHSSSSFFHLLLNVFFVIRVHPRMRSR